MRLEFRGLNQSYYIKFLEELGGTLQPSVEPSLPVRVIGNGWTADLDPEDHLAFSRSVLIPRTYITFSGDSSTVGYIISQFRLKALRGGG